MIPWELLDSVPIPGSKSQLHLYRRGDEYSIRVDRSELMNSRVHGSEDALARLACASSAGRPAARVLIGGLGMGYTVAAALAQLAADAEVVVAELAPAVVAWNRGPLATLARHPLDDGRVTVREVDVAQLLSAAKSSYDAILLDVDNGPEGLTRRDNRWLYAPAGLAAARAALRPEGILAIWSAGPSRGFTERLVAAGFAPQERRVRARGVDKGPWNTLWIAKR